MRLRLIPLLAALAFVLAPLAHAGVAPRIVGGEPVASGAYPFMAALLVPGFANDADAQTCGGTVIAPYAILTAAHCVVDRPTGLVVVTGKTDLAAAGGQHLAIRAMVAHPAFVNAGPFPDDIAVVLLAAPTSAPPIARATTTPVDGTATAAGWGAIDNAGTIYPSALQAATLAIQPQGDCGQALPICAGLTSPNICIGDSGGPLFTTVGTPVLLGVSSAVLQVGVDPCGGDSSMFTDVSLYTAWIDAQLVPAVAGVRVSVVAGKLRVSWQRTPGGAEPAVVVTTSDGTRHGAVTGATSLDVAGLPRGRALGATVTVTNAWGSASAASAGTATLPSPPVSTTRPKVTGKPKVGKTLTCGTGGWKATPAPSFAFGWRIGGKVSKTQKRAKLKLGSAMLGKSVSCIVTAKNPAAVVAARSAAVTVRHR